MDYSYWHFLQSLEILKVTPLNEFIRPVYEESHMHMLNIEYIENYLQQNVIIHLNVY